MAKKNQLSAELTLEQALISMDRQPYTVPDNWIWTTVRNINKYTGSSVNPSLTPAELFELYSVPSCEDDNPELLVGSEIGSTKQTVTKDDVLICKINPRINRVWIVSQHTEYHQVASSEWIVVRNQSINAKYLMWYFRSKYFREYMLSNVSGVGGSLMRAQPKYVQTYPVPIPPLAEQQRIVRRIESLFAKLDQAQEMAQNALDSFQSRKAAILHKAFSGKLTVKWRQNHGISMDSWKTTPLFELASIQTGLAKGKQITSDTTTMPYLRVANVQDGYLDLSEIKLITVEKDKIERYRLIEGDVLFTEGGDFDKLGRGTVWRAEIDNCLHQNHVFAVRPEPTVLNSFYLAYLASSRYGKAYFLSCSKQTTNLASINSTQLKAFPVICPSINEQLEIVRILDKLLKEEQKAKELSNIIVKIDQMKKAILGRAFRGMLGTNDNNEESAAELLTGESVTN
ncbi:restriction endonuclease subunit S [Paenibacillus sp. FSL P2-0136]|uniref:restriction endonuclease subunit S n=1 Tax=Paenibacillus sp. FSL P2-0136 TaxID=2975317 RepID=UPI0030DBD0C3